VSRLQFRGTALSPFPRVQRQHKAWHFESFLKDLKDLKDLAHLMKFSTRARLLPVNMILLLESLLKEHAAVALRTCIVDTKFHCLNSGCGDLFGVE
jgi:hypothetical protein